MADFITPDAQLESAAIQRQQALADLLRAQSMQPQQDQVINGLLMPSSNIAGLSRLGQGFIASNMQGGIDSRAKALAKMLYDQTAPQRELQALQLQNEKARMTDEKRIRDMIPQFQKQGAAALAPLAGDAESGILPSAGRAAVAPSFDYKGFANALAGVDPTKALQLQASLQKEGQINKLDAKDFTPESVQKFAQSGNYGDLVRMDKLAFQDVGGKLLGLNPFTGVQVAASEKTQSPDSKASNAVAWANNAIARERLNFDKSGGIEGVKPKLVGDQWVVAPNDMKPGDVKQAVPSTATKDAKEALQLIETAKTIIPKSTGSYLGTAVDQAARVGGFSTGGDTAAAQLRALEGALVSKMPKMSGPQSDKDVLLYKQMAGEIGDPTIPASRKLAALEVIKEIQMRHAGVSAPKTGEIGSGTFKIISVD